MTRLPSGSAAQARPLLAIAANDGWNLVNYRAPLIAALIRSGYEVLALAPSGPHDESIRAMGARFHPVTMQAKGKSPVGDLRTLLAYLAALRTFRPHAFLGFTAKPNIYGSLAAHALRIPVLNNISGLGAVFIKGGALRQLVTRLYRVALGRSATVFFQNPDDAAQFREAGLVRDDQVVLLPGSGVDLDHFQPVRSKDESEASVTFLFAGRLLWAKGVAEFVEAARQVRASGTQARFQILGIVEPPAAAAVPLERIREWQAEGIVDYLGAASDVREIMGRADCVVLPSYYREGVPRVLLEAAAMATPIVTTDAPGCREAVDDGLTGFLCQARSVDSLSGAIFRVIGLSSEQRRAMGAAGRAKMERQFRAELVHDAYLQALTKLGVAGS